jgi:hypothetical protein
MTIEKYFQMKVDMYTVSKCVKSKEVVFMCFGMNINIQIACPTGTKDVVIISSGKM